jgi:tripartite-type tricarboxylate transporter receptor subunit TctC
MFKTIPGRVLAIVSLLAAFASPAAWSQDAWPSRPVKLVVSFPAGGAVDVVLRDFATRLSTSWGQPVVIDNKPGGNGVIAADLTAKAPPDGYTLFASYDGMIVLPFLQDKLPYDTLADLRPIGMVTTLPLVLVASPHLKINTLPELIAAAKAQPGAMEYASNGVGATPHMAMEFLQRAAGVKLKHIPYRGSGPALQDILGGRVGVMWAAVPSAMAHIKSGKLVPLAYGSRQRSPLLPQVPTVAELGFPGFEAVSWVALVGPAKMPNAVVQKINADLQKIIHDTAFVEQQVTKGSELRGGSSDDLARQIRQEFDRNKALFASGAIAKE